MLHFPSPEFMSNLTSALEAAIQGCAAYLQRQTKPDGMFVYRVNMSPHIAVGEGYNILRHAGTLYSMAVYHRRYPSVKMLDAIQWAGGYLRDKAVFALREKENADLAAVWSTPETTASSEEWQAKLGGTGLGLVALSELNEIIPDFAPISTLRALGNFLIYMQKEDGSFYSKYYPARAGRDDSWVSLYYPGEAALGLLMLYEKDPDQRWLNCAGKALAYLAASRQGNEIVDPDHWALMATEKILGLPDKSAIPVSEEILFQHAIQVCKSILTRLATGNLFQVGKTTPIATSIEGILAASGFLPPDHELRRPVNLLSEKGLQFLLSAQVSDGIFAGAIPRAVSMLPEKKDTEGNIDPEVKKFNARVQEIRIDYVQHAMSAMMQYVDIKKKGSS